LFTADVSLFNGAMALSMTPSNLYFVPNNNAVTSYNQDNRDTVLTVRANRIHEEMKEFVSQTDYPCTAAIKSMRDKDYRLGVYSDFGGGVDSFELGRDLLVFLNEQKRSRSPYSSFWAVFDKGRRDFHDKEFEINLWKELSFLTSFDRYVSDWDPEFSADPRDKNFCFSLGGSAMFVVGLHPNSSQRSRAFKYPTLIFNVYDQFHQLMEHGEFESMVQVNHRRDIKFSGSVDPTVSRYNEEWESIQFSGAKKGDNWVSPFQFGLKPSG
jgi:FPC/CPF motif-containing protein YcgG